MDRFFRHIRFCNAPPPPGSRRPFRIGGAIVGWLTPAFAEALLAQPNRFRPLGEALALAPFAAEVAGDDVAAVAQRSLVLAEALPALVAAGHCRLRGEAFDVRAASGERVLAQLDRGALPAFGVAAEGVHVNGLVRRADGLHVWIGVRAMTKSVAPGQLDHLVAGGIPAGLGPAETLVKEAAEEASIPAALAGRARKVAEIRYTFVAAEGMRRDLLHCYDLELPEDFAPAPSDGEVERFELWPAARVLAAVRDTDTVKFNVNLVLIDLFLREGLIDPASTEGQALWEGLAGAAWP